MRPSPHRFSRNSQLYNITWRSCTTNFTQIGKNNWKERAEILILMLHVPCKMSNATYLTNFSSTKKCMKSWLDNLNGQTFNYFRDYGRQYAHFYKTKPCFNFFPPQRTPVPNVLKIRHTVYSHIFVKDRRTDKRTERERLTDVLSTNMFLFSVRE
jgi:hypothetical protein